MSELENTYAVLRDMTNDTYHKSLALQEIEKLLDQNNRVKKELHYHKIQHNRKSKRLREKNLYIDELKAEIKKAEKSFKSISNERYNLADALKQAEAERYELRGFVQDLLKMQGASYLTEVITKAHELLNKTNN